MMSLSHLTDFEISRFECGYEHESYRNRWLKLKIPNLCLECYGRDVTIQMLTTGLQGKLALSTDLIYELLFKHCPDVKDAKNLKYICECSAGHIFENTLGRILQGIWCQMCLSLEKLDLVDLGEIAIRRRGLCLSNRELPFNFHSKYQFVCCQEHIFYETPLEILYGVWCRNCDPNVSVEEYPAMIEQINPQSIEIVEPVLPRVEEMSDEICVLETASSSLWNGLTDIQLSTINEFTLIKNDGVTVNCVIRYEDIRNPSHIVRMRCKNGHVFKSAPVIQNPRQWCWDEECDGVDRCIFIIMTMLGASLEIFERHEDIKEEYLSADDETKSHFSFTFTCSRGHSWVSHLLKVLQGQWCSMCLCDGYHSVESKKLLAKTFKGRYDAKKEVFLCRQSAQITKWSWEILRGKRCRHDDHVKCVEINRQQLSSGEQEAIKTQALAILTRNDRIQQLKDMDVTTSLTHEQVIHLVDKYPRANIELLYLRSKYDTIQKIHALARQKGIKCLETNIVSICGKLTWSCGKLHQGKEKSWNATLQTIMRTASCKHCRLEDKERLLRLQPKYIRHKTSKGHRAVKAYLDSKGIRYIEEHKYKDCRFVKKLRFDFYLPDYNILIEFDGRQHFMPVKFFGGISSFDVQVKKDNIKAKYCMKNRISLIRVNDLKSISADLDLLIGLSKGRVMFINIDAKYSGLHDGYLKTGDSDYFVRKFKV